MASVVKRINGRKSIQFTDANGKRRELRIGKASDVQANKVRVHVEAILADKLANRPHDVETLKWIHNLSKKLFVRAEAVGLVSGASRAFISLGEFLDECMQEVQKNEENTYIFYKNTRRNLISFFGTERRLSSITADDAAAFRSFLETLPKSRGKGTLSPATVNRRIGATRTFFKMARKRKIIMESPFEDVKAGEQVNRSRLQFITEETIAKVLLACPDAQWYAIVCLARYGGVRCPSEIVPLKWEHIDWENRRVLIHCVKTKRLPGKETRLIPLFPQLERAFLKLAARLPVYGDERDTYVIPRYRSPKANLRTQFEKILKRAGVEPWPRLLQNLRASREKDLSRQFPLEVAADWIGNTSRIALKHYLGTTDEDFAAALGDKKPPQNPPQQPAELTDNAKSSAEAESATFVITIGGSTTLTADSSAFLPLTKT
jgi:integrase